MLHSDWTKLFIDAFWLVNIGQRKQRKLDMTIENILISITTPHDVSASGNFLELWTEKFICISFYYTNLSLHAVIYISFPHWMKAPECSRRFSVYIFARRARDVSFIYEVAIVKCCVVCKVYFGKISLNPLDFAEEFIVLSCNCKYLIYYSVTWNKCINLYRIRTDQRTHLQKRCQTNGG